MEENMRRLTRFLTVTLFLAFPVLSVAADGWLGVYTQTVDPDLKEAFRLESDYGVIINHVVDNSPADEAGLKQGDIIISLDGTKLTGSDQLSEMIRKYQKGDQVKMTVLRKGKELTLTATIGVRDDDDALALLEKSKSPKPYKKSFSYYYDKSSLSNSYIGINLESLNAQLGEYFGVKDGEGALVTEVIDESPAQKAGLKAGDVIVSIDGKPVKSPSDVQKAIRKKDKGDKATIGILREKKNMEMAVEIEERSAFSFDMPDIVIPDVPGLDNFDFHYLPKMKGLYHGDFDDDIPSMEGLEESMKQLQEQMQKLQEQMEEMRLKSEQKD
jgi:S1-C subfamily serine protease